MKEATETNIDLAKYFFEFGEKLLLEDKNSVLNVEKFFRNSIRILKNNGKAEETKMVHKRLIEIQKRIPEIMSSYSIPFKAERIIKNIIENMDGLNFQESILRIAQMTPFYKKDEFKKKVIENASSAPLVYMFKKSTINENGQTVFSLPGLNVSNPEDNKELLEKYIHNEMLNSERISGDFFLRFMFEYIIEHFDVKNEDFGFLVNDSIIIPEGRENIISIAFKLAFQGDLYGAIHILAPQLENIFRFIAKEVGAITSILYDEGYSQEKTLSAVFDLPELIDSYDNDILFMFKGLLNEHSGANIRNEIAHGLMNPKRSLSGECLFFVAAVIKFLVMYSRYCTQILNGEKLQNYKKLDTNIDFSGDEEKK